LTVRVEGGPRRAEGWLLDQYSFERACFDWSGFGEDRRSLDLSLPITLLPYAVASIGGVQ
jgi:hypothetical protein